MATINRGSEITAELDRLNDKLTRLDDWLTAHETYPQALEREQLWLRTLKKYERLFDERRAIEEGLRK